jgi:uncharacterized protein
MSTMSDQTPEHVGRSFAEAMASQDVVTAASLLHPDVMWHFPGADHALAGDHHGLDGVATFAQAVSELTAGTFHMDLHEVYASADGVVISFTGSGTRPDGRRLNNPTLLRCTVSEGLITELWEFVWDLDAVGRFWR